jgi:molecular chaperone Hsp33
MPGAAEETIEVLEKNVSLMPPISNLVSSEKGPKEVLDLLTVGLPVIIHEERPVRYECKCSKERLERVLINLGLEELRDIIDTQGKAELTCHFCAEQYEFNRAELEALIEQIQEKSS